MAILYVNSNNSFSYLFYKSLFHIKHTIMVTHWSFIHNSNKELKNYFFKFNFFYGFAFF